jgi:hypothetical protein
MPLMALTESRRLNSMNQRLQATRKKLLTAAFKAKK